MSKGGSGNSTVTMRDVAEAAGVSRMTVSRALKDNSSISKETRERILRIIRDMNYVPDQMAGSLSTKKSRFVAVLLPSLNNLHFALTVQAMTEGLADTGLQILLGHTNYSAETEESVLEMMLRRRPELIVLSYDGHTDRTRSLLKDAAIPVIEIWEKPEQPLEHIVGFSNEDAAYEMTIALIKRGYKDIIFLCEDEDQWTRGSARRKGFRRAMIEQDRDPDRILRSGNPPLDMETAATAVEPLLDQFPDADCVFCVSDMAAFGLLSGLKKAGKRVPDDIAIAGFGNFEVSRFSSPSISTVKVDPWQIGLQTAYLTKHLLNSGESEADGILGKDTHSLHIPTSLIFRESTR